MMRASAIQSSKSFMPQTGIQIYLLGSFRLILEGVVVPNSQWQKRKAKLLVQILALNPSHELHREELIEILFPEFDIKTANANLYRVLHAARKALEPSRGSYALSNYLINNGEQIKLVSEDNLWIDAEEFERKAGEGLKTDDQDLLESAAVLYTGDLLSDMPFEEWTTDRRERLKALFHKLLRRLAEKAEKRNDAEEAHNWLDKILQHEPADEIAHRAKIRLYARQGDVTLALRQYEKCCDILRRELSVKPDTETERLKQKILDAKR